MAQPIHTRAGPARVSASVGVVLASEVDSVEQLFDRADSAMYAFKEERRGRA